MNKTSVTRFVIISKYGEYLVKYNFWSWDWSPNIWEATLFRSKPDISIIDNAVATKRFNIGYSEQAY